MRLKGFAATSPDHTGDKLVTLSQNRVRRPRRMPCRRVQSGGAVLPPPGQGRREGDSGVPAHPDTSHGSRILSKDRMEGFSDGVFGFAITLLVLDIAIHPPGTPLQRLLHAWPFYLGLHHQLPDDRRCVAPAHRLDRSPRPGRSSLPATQPARSARSGLPAVPGPGSSPTPCMTPAANWHLLVMLVRRTAAGFQGLRQHVLPRSPLTRMHERAAVRVVLREERARFCPIEHVRRSSIAEATGVQGRVVLARTVEPQRPPPPVRRHL